jgi:Cutinase
MGAAGSGERGAEVTMNGGMGRVVYQSFNALKQLVERDGRTITAEAVDYPATAVPEDGGVLDWANFMGSVDAGTAALGGQYASFAARCPSAKVVLAGYSQGAMVVHRNLHALAASPNLAASLLIADGDRLPDDPTVNIGSVTSVPGAGKGVAQDWPILAHVPAALPVALGSKTISVCDLGDAVCDYDEDSEDSESVMATAAAIHTSYDISTRGGQAWTSLLHQLLGPTPAALPVVQASS